jgi:hypothetical protein
MKIILTENQIEFIRRYEKIKELIDEGIDVISNDEDFCGFNSSAFIEEVCWQVSDKMEHLNLPTNTVGMIENVHKWVKDNFDTYILEKFEIIMYDSNCNERFDDVDDEEYNLQESDDTKEYDSSLKNALLRRHNVIMSEMDHYITNNLACDEYPDDVEGFKDYILEEVTDQMMFTHNVNKWEWHDVYLSLEDMIGTQIKKTFKSWAKKHC